MKRKELQASIKKALDKKEITEDSEVILVGEYNYGSSLGKPYTTTMSLIEEDVIEENVKVLAISTDAYVYEHEDLGYCRMWVDEETLKEFKENIEEEEEE